jgi:hypothetical protein
LSFWGEFWRNQDNSNGDECEEKYLSETKLYFLFEFTFKTTGGRAKSRGTWGMTGLCKQGSNSTDA